MSRTARLTAAAAAAIAGTMALWWGGGQPAQAEQLDLDSIFRCRAADEAGKADCREARDLIMGHCNSCHSFIRIVYYQASAEKWAPVLERMHLKAPRLTDADMAKIAAYVAENFGDDQPPPPLPQVLIELSMGGG